MSGLAPGLHQVVRRLPALQRARFSDSAGGPGPGLFADAALISHTRKGSIGALGHTRISLPTRPAVNAGVACVTAQMSGHRDASNALSTSQALFEDFRKANCAWYGERLEEGASASDITKGCLIRMTLERAVAYALQDSERLGSPAQ